MSAKVDKVITSFEKHRKRPNVEFEENLAYLFDITKTMYIGFVVRTENCTKVKLNQEVGWDIQLWKWLLYQQSIHQKGPNVIQNPRQWLSLNPVIVTKEVAEVSVTMKQLRKTFPERVQHAIQQSLLPNWCLNTLCHQENHHRCFKIWLKMDLVSQHHLFTPWSGVWRRTIRDAEQVKNCLMELISKEKSRLHFDGKKFDNKKY